MPITGGGGGGDTYVPYSSTYFTYYAWIAKGDSDFVATISDIPSANVIEYNNPTSGDEDFLGYYDGIDQIGMLVLHNTTRTESELVRNAIVASNQIILNVDVPGTWEIGDTITLRSQVCDIGGSPYYFDLDVSDVVPAAATVLYLACAYRDSGGVASLATHPYETYGAGKSFGTNAPVAGVLFPYFTPVPLVSQRFCFRLNAVAAGTCDVLWFKIMGWELP